MILKMFSVFDSKAEAFLPPFFYGTKGQAVRAFSDAVNDEAHEFRRHAEDYTLFDIGEFDQSSGMLSWHDAPVALGNALTFLLDREIKSV